MWLPSQMSLTLISSPDLGTTIYAAIRWASSTTQGLRTAQDSLQASGGAVVRYLYWRPNQQAVCSAPAPLVDG